MKKLSIVYAVRNDDFNGNFYYRFYMSLLFLEKAILSNKLKSKIEIIVVDWNSKTPFNIKKDFPKGIQKNIKLIIVRPPLLSKHKITSKFKVTQAVNTGIRRAKAKYILNINSDILITEIFLKRLFELIKENKINNKFLQIPRKFIPHQITELQLSQDDLKKYIKMFSRYFNQGGKVPGLMSGAGGFLARKNTWHKLEGFSETYNGHGWTDIELGIKIKNNFEIEKADYYGLCLYDLQQNIDIKKNINSHPFIITKNKKNWGLGNVKLPISTSRYSTEKKKEIKKFGINKKEINLIKFIKSFFLTEKIKLKEIKELLNHLYTNDYNIVNLFIINKSIEYVEFLTRYCENSIINYSLDIKKINNFEKKHLRLHFVNYLQNNINLIDYFPVNKFNKKNKLKLFSDVIPNIFIDNKKNFSRKNLSMKLLIIFIYIIFPIKFLFDCKDIFKKLLKFKKL